MQRALIQYRLPENYNLVKEALLKEGRGDLIGFGPGCLIPPRPMAAKDNRHKDAEKKEHKDNKPVKGKKDNRNGRPERKDGRPKKGKR